MYSYMHSAAAESTVGTRWIAPIHSGLKRLLSSSSNFAFNFSTILLGSGFLGGIVHVYYSAEEVCVCVSK